eukprot:4563191-Prymnesium_polylepis.1
MDASRRLVVSSLLVAAALPPAHHALALSGASAVLRPSLQTFEIESSPRDPRSYRGMILPSGLRVLLASDPSAEKAAVAMDVRVGTLSDPRSLPGLAHFCEHMLFLGSEQFPEAGEFDRYVAAGGGSSN